MKKLVQAIESVGFAFSLKHLIAILFGVEACVFFTSLLYLLNVPYMAILLVIGLIITPYVYWFGIKYKYEKEKYEGLCLYMEQMSYSFQNTPKIYNALKETSSILKGKAIKAYVDKAIEFFETKDGSYRDGLAIIEEEYNCKKLNQLHKLFIKIEEEGGSYNEALNLLINDTNHWKDRTSIFQQEKRGLRFQYLVALFLSIASCCLATFLAVIAHKMEDAGNVTRYLDITGSVTYQLISFLFIAMCLISFYLINKKYISSWIKDDQNSKYILERYDICLNYNVKEATLKILPAGMIFLVLGVVLCILGFVPGAIACVIGFALIIAPTFKFKTAWSDTQREIKDAFCLWLIDLELNMQFYAPQIALLKSYDIAPVILKEPLMNLINEVDNDLSGIEPYNNFLKEFNIPEVQSAMRIIYSMKDINSEKTTDLLNALLDRNYALQDHVEAEKTKAKISNTKLLLFVPMGFAMFKVVADLLIFANVFFSGFNNISNFM